MVTVMSATRSRPLILRGEGTSGDAKPENMAASVPEVNAGRTVTRLRIPDGRSQIVKIWHAGTVANPNE